MSEHLQPNAARADHARAIEAFLSAARAVADEAWERPLHADGWTPAQVCDHVRLTYVTLREELEGRQGFRVRTSWWQRVPLRWRVLPRILSTGRMPAGVRAPREIRPADGPYPREPLLKALEQAARFVEDTLVQRWNDPTCSLHHHLIGRLSPEQALPLAATHTRHHGRQIGAADR